MRKPTAAKIIVSFVLGLQALILARAQTTATLTIQANQPGAVVNSNLFGIFFEEINFAGEGGLYAEMVRNRSFYDAAGADYWTLATEGTATGAMSVDPSRPLNTNILNSLKLTMKSGSGSVGAGNSGFWGMSFQAGAAYNLSFYAAASNGFTGPITARLESSSGANTYAQATFSGLTTNWQLFTASLVSDGADTNGRIVLSMAAAGTIWLDVVSLFPQATFMNRPNGLRPDLAAMLSGLHPSFLRFPGGNFVEGSVISNAVRWKTTVGSIANRPGHEGPWGYWSTDGLGYHEYLQFCEDMGMEPLLDINCGLALGYDGAASNTVPLDEMGPWVQDALDAIEYANGATNTAWGAQRAANGHPAPFNLRYIEIGNENGGPYYNQRYPLFYNAIKSNYPAMNIIAPDWGGIPTAAPVEIQDEHYYSSAATFISYATKYDSYSRAGPKVFVGEYAVTADYGAYDNLSSALGEAAFMTGMERNSDLVLMASYAPLFANVNGMQWQPDMIYYDSARAVFGTPSYYVQQLFSQNRGDVVLPMSLIVPTNALLASSTYASETGEIIIKAVNPYATPVAATIKVLGVNTVSPIAALVQLASASASAQNTFLAPTSIFPVTNSISNAGTNFNLTLPANSLSILRLAATGINSYTNLMLQCLSPIYRGQSAASTVSGEMAGNWTNLTANANHAITWSSADTNIAVVDPDGNVTGVGWGATSIIATYASLGLSATQAVQVIYSPATLMHRYSFKNGNANDSIGSANGALHGQAAISGGQLVLPNTTSAAPATDYLQLPSGILTNAENAIDPAVTVEAWATFSSGQYTWANLFDFGNRDAAGYSEYDIHVCAHSVDNATIAGISDSDNANVDYQYEDLGSGTSLDGSANIHVAAVFDPPAGYVAIYLNGTLAGEDYNVTIPMSGVEDVRNIVGADNWPDPGMKGSIAELRIYNGALSPSEIAGTQALGPTQLLSAASPTLGTSLSDNNLTLTWPVVSSGFTLQSATNLSPAVWTNVLPGPQISGGQWKISLPVSRPALYYRLAR